MGFCGTTAAGTCAGPSELCVYDPAACPGMGCNAGGAGDDCRFCGFGPFTACPAPGPGLPPWLPMLPPWPLGPPPLPSTPPPPTPPRSPSVPPEAPSCPPPPSPAPSPPSPPRLPPSPPPVCHVPAGELVTLQGLVRCEELHIDGHARVLNHTTINASQVVSLARVKGWAPARGASSRRSGIHACVHAYIDVHMLGPACDGGPCLPAIPSWRES